MLAFMWWIVIGLLAGLIARFLIPGKQAMGWVMTIVLGLAGSLIGGFVSSALFGEDPTDSRFHPAGLLMSTVGALILLGLYVAYNKRRPGSIPRA
jgi:uncharacterized membrane protein YeaQ/YmgE (transglycosylase-associated protein family)